MKELLNTHSDKASLYLNAGDNFQGTLWYNLLRWNVTSTFLNMLKADAIVSMQIFEFKNEILADPRKS